MIEWNGKKLAEEISNHISDSVVSSDDNSVYISREKIYEVSYSRNKYFEQICKYLKYSKVLAVHSN